MNLLNPKYFLLFLAFAMTSCSQTEKPVLVVAEEPIIKLTRAHSGHEFSIVLDDMDVTEDETNTIYRHKYVILQPKEDSLVVDSTGWVNVGEKLFQDNEKNLGMELVSYHNGEISAVPKPVGFGWAVGNEKYGEWAVDSTVVSSTGQPEKTWHYHRRPGHFMFYYWMFSRRTPMSSYSAYNNGFRGKQAFYGVGKDTYGTKSAYQRKHRSAFYSRRQSSRTWSNHKSRVSRRSSRFRGGSRSRGRSGGFGK